MYKSFLSVEFGLSHFCLDFFLNLAMFQIFSMFQTFSFRKRSRQKWLSSNFFLSVKFCTCVFYYINSWKHWSFLSVKFGLSHFYLDFFRIWLCSKKKFRHRKNLEHSQIQKKSSQKWLSPNLTLRKYLYMDTPTYTCIYLLSIFTNLMNIVGHFGQFSGA